MDAGKLRHRITLQKAVSTQDATTGDITDVWTTQKTVWAAIEPLSAREFMQSNADQSQVMARITIRHTTDITAAWRVVHGSTIYNIHGVLPDIDSGLEYMTLPVSSGVNNG